MKPIKRICLFTATGAENLGDELITLCEIRSFQNAIPEIEITLFSHDGERTKRFFLSQKLSLKNIVIKEYFPNALRKQPFKNIRLFWETLKSIKNTDHVYIGGGGLLYGTDEEGHSPLRLWWFRAVITKFLRKPLTYLSIGVSATEDELKPFSKGIFSGSTVTVRDKKSQTLLTELTYDSQILPDPVFNYSGKKEKDSKIIGIALRKGFLSDETIHQILKKLITQGYDILLLPHSLHPTDEVSHDGYYLQNFLLPGVATTQSIEQTLAAYKRCHIVISMRLHSMVLAIDHGIPFIAISYAQKTSSLLTESAWNYSFDTHVGADSLLSAVRDIESRYTSLEEKLKEIQQKFQKSYTDIFTKLGK